MVELLLRFLEIIKSRENVELKKVKRCPVNKCLKCFNIIIIIANLPLSSICSLRSLLLRPSLGTIFGFFKKRFFYTPHIDTNWHTHIFLHKIPTDCDISGFTLSSCVAGCHHQVGGGNVEQGTGEGCSAAELLLRCDARVIHCVCGGKHRCVPRNCGRGTVSTVLHFCWWTRSWERGQKLLNGNS